MSEDVADLYQSALHQIEAAQRHREDQYPKIEALRKKWKAEFDGGDELNDATSAQVLIDVFARDVEALLDPDEDDPIDYEEWLEFGGEDDE